MDHVLTDLVDIGRLRDLLQSLHDLSGLPLSLVDSDGTTLYRSEFSEICGSFHRAHPESLACCYLCRKIAKANLDKEHILQRCGNGLWDLAVPVLIEGRHMATVVSGQFLFDDEEPDRKAFISRARDLGYDEQAYLRALGRVRRVSHSFVEKFIAHLVRLVRTLTDMGLANLRVKDTAAHLPGMIFQLKIASNGDWSMPYASEGCRDLFGLEPEAIMADINTIMDTLPPEDAKRMRRDVEICRQKMIPFRLEHRVLREDGEVGWVKVTSTPTALSDGGVLFSGVSIDVTRRRRTQEALRLNREALRQSRERYKQLFDNAPVGVFVTTSDGQALQANMEMARILGFDNPEQALSRVRDVANQLFVNPSRRKELLEGLRANGRVENFEYEARTWDNRRCWLSLNARVGERLEDGHFVLEGYAVDSTAKKKAEWVLRESESRFRALFENAPLPYYSLDENGCILDVNRQWIALLGYAKSEVVGAWFGNFLPKPQRMEFPKEFAKLKEQGISNNHESEMLCKDGGVVQVSCTGQIQLDEEGRFKCTHCILTDVSAWKRAEREMREAKDKAEAASRTKSEFLANMSHEIRTPLNGILGMLQVLERMGTPPEQAGCVERAQDSARRLTRLLTDILDISRIESGKMAVEKAPFAPAEILETVQGLFAPAAEEKGLYLNFQADPDIPAVLVGDSTRLTQILFNLVGNAVKFTARGGVEVAAYRLTALQPGKARLLFVVSDTGIGIPEEAQPRILEAFTQQEESYARQYGGAGLGLAIVKRLVGLMGGTMAMDTEKDVGSAFHVCLSFDLDGEAPQPEAGPEPDIEADLQGARILVVEDEAVNRLALKHHLNSRGCVVSTALNGRQALDMLGREVFDLVLMDVQMPLMDGLAATRAVRNREEFRDCRNLPIIALTAYALDGDRERCAEAGMDGYLAKPVEAEDLFKTVGRILAKAKARPTA